MKVVVYTNPRAPHQIKFHGAMASGIEASGQPVERRQSGDYIPSDVAVVWGERRRLAATKYAKRVLVLEIGYLPQNRSAEHLKYISIGWDGLNNRADFCNDNAPADRWQKHGVPVRDWKEGGDYVLVLGQVPGDYSHRHADINQFYSEAITRLSVLGLPIRFRPHPLARQSYSGCVLDTSDSLESALEGAAVAVTFNSNSGVDAVLNGVPTITMDKGAMAWDVTGHNYAKPPRPDRGQWLNALAYCQWTEQEIMRGDAWEHLRRGYE